MPQHEKDKVILAQEIHLQMLGIKDIPQRTYNSDLKDIFLKLREALTKYTTQIEDAIYDNSYKNNLDEIKTLTDNILTKPLGYGNRRMAFEAQPGNVKSSYKGYSRNAFHNVPVKQRVDIMLAIIIF